ncbi:MAG: glutamine synthetase type III [Ruminococcaceae bacterium]|nr:glutamine synthetase type III [Oscillospiraceae bacterium]
MNNIQEIFGSMVFNESVMREKLPKDTYKLLRKTIDEGEMLDLTVANVVANAMKDWAIEKGATHFTHWFQPMTGVTAEKHDSFITPINKGRDVIMEFSGKELIKGEPDASSFPSGGLRATFEARGYTAWDPTSFAFIKDDTLCIPTAFCSYGGEALDKKTPLLRSMEVVTKQASRVLHLLGTEAQVVSTMGPEQEYFLVDKKLYDRRKDLVITGRTLFGARPPKGQELEDHYFGSIKPRVKAFMAELDSELWKLGVLAKTEHNEAAPAQHELAPIFTTTNIATDHNQLTMEMMKTVAARHGLVCLLHEKPYAGVNGSGKHNNWSLAIKDGANLLDPGETPQDNARFLLFLCAVIAAVDDYQDLLRVSVSSAGNDHRLGAAEAPPAIMSIFLGDELTSILDSIESDTIYDAHQKALMEIGANVLPKFPKDTTDRNRTSPFAFTGNKFEFRSCGSSMSISGPNLTLNTIVAEELSRIADRLEAELAAGMDVNKAVGALIKSLYTEHKRVIFNGNNYSDEWVAEAERRGLLNLRTTPDALPYFISEKNIALYEKHHIFTETEMRSRHEIHMESYCKVIGIEALTMRDMAQKQLLPAVLRCKRALCETAAASAAIGIENDAERVLAAKIGGLANEMYAQIGTLDAAISDSQRIPETEAKMHFIRDTMIPAMNALRSTADELELMCDAEIWPIPTYDELLFQV